MLNSPKLIEINKIINMFVDYNQRTINVSYVYAIGKKEDLMPPYTNCYIGVTDYLEKRWIRHTKSKYTVGKFIRKHKLTRDNMIVILESDKDKCFELEEMLRHNPNMGLNEAKGGMGGYTSYTKERNEKISKCHVGKTLSEEHKKNISKSKKGQASGNKNNKAKKWLLVSPEGIKYYIHGNLYQMCENLRILPSALRYYKNNVVPEIKSNTQGGFREKNEKSKELRMNTTGWILFEESFDSGGV